MSSVIIWKVNYYNSNLCIWVIFSDYFEVYLTLHNLVFSFLGLNSFNFDETLTVDEANNKRMLPALMESSILLKFSCASLFRWQKLFLKQFLKETLMDFRKTTLKPHTICRQTWRGTLPPVRPCLCTLSMIQGSGFHFLSHSLHFINGGLCIFHCRFCLRFWTVFLSLFWKWNRIGMKKTWLRETCHRG